MDAKYLYESVERFKAVFDVARLVDTDKMEICNLDAQGNMTREPYKCYAVWNKSERCVNCISAKACAHHQKLEKFEFVDHDIYYVVSKAVELGENTYALELVTKVTDETLFEAFGKDQFAQAICEMNQKMYMDKLTSLNNRRYYDEQKGRLDRAKAAAVIDVDHFKQMNDTYGHLFGDEVLKAIAAAVRTSVRKTDTVIRYGGDELYVVFDEMDEKFLHKKLELIRQRVSEIRFAEKPEVRLSISIGGYYKKNEDDDLFAKADANLYEAKQTRNTVVA